MQRVFRAFMLIVVVASITGCGEDTAVNSAAESPAAAKEAAAKMPPPSAAKGAPAK
jgi:predicted small lipoprotein YifL